MGWGDNHVEVFVNLWLSNSPQEKFINNPAIKRPWWNRDRYKAWLRLITHGRDCMQLARHRTIITQRKTRCSGVTPRWLEDPAIIIFTWHQCVGLGWVTLGGGYFILAETQTWENITTVKVQVMKQVHWQRPYPRQRILRLVTELLLTGLAM